MVLRVQVGLHTTQWELGTCCYLFRRLFGPRCPLVKDLEYLVVSIDDNLSSLSGQMDTSHRCTVLVYDVLYVINAYINTCIKAYAMADPSDTRDKTQRRSSFLIWTMVATTVGHYHPHSVIFS